MILRHMVEMGSAVRELRIVASFTTRGLLAVATFLSLSQRCVIPLILLSCQLGVDFEHLPYWRT